MCICIHAQFGQDDLIQLLFHHQQWHIVNGVGVDALDDGIRSDVAKTRHLGANRIGEFVLCSAHEDVRLDAKFEQLLNGVLGWFCLQFTRCRQVGNQGEVNDECFLRAFPLHLTDRLDVRQGFDVPNRATDFGDDEVVIGFSTENLNTSFDFVGDVRNDLHGLAQVFSAAFFIDDRLVNAAGGDVVGLGGLNVEESFIMP